MNTNEQKARISLLLKRYDEAKTTDAEEVELAEFFRAATEVPEQWQDYAVLFSVLDSVDTLFNDKESDTRPSRRGWWWAASIAAAIILIAGLFIWSYNDSDDVLPNRARVYPPLPASDTSDYVSGPPQMPVVTQEVRKMEDGRGMREDGRGMREDGRGKMEEGRRMREEKPSQVKPEQIAAVDEALSGQHAEELLAEETSLQKQTTDSHSQSIRIGGLPTDSATKGLGGGYVRGGFGGATYLRGLTMTHADSMLIGRVAGVGNTTTGKKGKYITMRGYVMDEGKQPIANARIMVAGTPGSVYTDKNGFFEARLNNALRVQVVCEGYETKQDIKPKKKMKIMLKKIVGQEEPEKYFGALDNVKQTGLLVKGATWDSTLVQKLRDDSSTEIHPYDTLFGGGTGIGPAIRLGGNPASNAWRDSILVLLNGEEYPEFLTHFDINGKADIDMFDYFYQQNQLLMRMSYMWWFHKDMVQSYAEKYNRSALNFVVNLRTVKFTPVRKLTKKKIAARKLAYMLNKYRKGYDSNMWVDDYYSPEMFGNEYEELLFGLKAIHNAHNELEYFGAIHEDKNGVYVPLIREMEIYSFAKPDAPTTSHDEFMAIFQRAASKADTNLHGEDSVKYMAFMYGGKKIRKVKPFYSMFFDWELPRKRVFDFQVDEDAKSAWWCEVHLYPELHHESTPEDLRAEFYFCTYDKLYAKDCPEILTNKRFVEGTVVDSSGKPMEGVNVSRYFSNDGAITDANGHFSFWMPYKEAHISATQEGYKITHVPYTGEALKIVLYRYGEKEPET